MNSLLGLELVLDILITNLVELHVPSVDTPIFKPLLNLTIKFFMSLVLTVNASIALNCI